MKLICIGAHPDDPEVFAGGVMSLFARAGHDVLAVSLTNGDVGHHEMGGGALAIRRYEEAQRAAAIGGYRSLVLDNHDGELEVTLALRKEVVRLIRAHKADLVFTHRCNDYHPDHRYAAQLVQDAAFMVTVPHFCSDTPALRKNPIFMYLYDPFTNPSPFAADVAIPTDPVMDLKWRLLDAMDSQFYEWLPWLAGVADQVPPATDPKARRQWLEAFFSPELQEPLLHYKDCLRDWCGAAAETTRYAEVFQLCEYGRRADPDELKELFACTLKSDGASL
ncbi:MAG: PIG-L family deacetylase [Candidatus Hydrogenedentales bacterium]